MERLSFDTSFLIDLQRELAVGSSNGRGHEFIRGHQVEEYCLSLTALGEFAAGFASLEDELFQGMKSRFRVIAHDEGVAMAYAKIFRALKADGLLIGSNDLWIAATAIRHEMPLVTRNVEEFRRVRGLVVVGY